MSEKESQITLKASYEGQKFIDGELVSALSLQELDEEGKAGKLLTAYDYTLTFDIIDAILIRNVRGDGRTSDETRKEDDQPFSTTYSESISAKLIHTTTAFWGAKKLSLLGSTEPIENEHMSIRIGRENNEGEEWFRVSAGSGFEVPEWGDFPPFLEIVIGLPEEKFRPLANAVGTEGVRTGRLALKDLQGLYAEDTYEVSAIDEIKILEYETVSWGD